MCAFIGMSICIYICLIFCQFNYMKNHRNLTTLKVVATDVKKIICNGTIDNFS